MEVVTYNAIASLTALIDQISSNNVAEWSVLAVKRHYFKSMTNEAFTLAIRPAVQEAANLKIYFVDAKKIYIAWQGNPKTVYRHLRNYIMAAMIQTGLTVEPTKILSYYDACAQAEDVKALLRSDKKDLTQSLAPRTDIVSDDPFDDGTEEEDAELIVGESSTGIKASPAQAALYNQIRAQKPFRKQLSIMVVEDQMFSQKLLCEILRGVRHGGREAPAIDALQSLQEAWKVFLKNAPDISFIDLGLVDGSGHSLARAIKELDSTARVIIVTANNIEEEQDVARQNNVDGFIAKPYNKKQILDCVEKYVGSLKSSSKAGGRSGSVF